MSGVELITAALAAGATAGLTDTTSAAIRDAYGRLSSLLANRNALPAPGAEPDPAVLADSGAVTDEQVLDAARRVLKLSGNTFVVGTNNGAVGEFHAPVTFHAPLPPS
ncbi:hypothetical protein ACFY36_32005 [Actinoplanes sp. NPDC000266]